MRYIGWYWDGWLGKLMSLLDEQFDIQIGSGGPTLAFKIGATCLFIFIVLEIYNRVRNAIQNYLDSKKKFIDVSYYENDEPFVDALEAAKNPEKILKPLIKDKQWGRVASIYASLNKHKEAARYFTKAGDLKGAAQELARAGNTMKAAKLLMKQKDYVTAARFFEEVKAYAKAASAYALAGDSAKAAEANGRAGKIQASADVFVHYFESSEEPMERQVQMANACYTVLQSTGDKLDEATRSKLTAQVAERFLRTGRTDLAASLFADAGDYAGAAQCYVQAKNLVRAAECYEQAGDLPKAAYMFLQVKQPERAVTALQPLTPSDPGYGTSRPILARALYELKNYAHCAAILAPLVQGQAPSASNLDLFYLFGIAQEQQGALEQALATLNAVQAVSPQYADLARRIPTLNEKVKAASLRA